MTKKEFVTLAVNKPIVDELERIKAREESEGKARRWQLRCDIPRHYFTAKSGGHAPYVAAVRFWSRGAWVAVAGRTKTKVKLYVTDTAKNLLWLVNMTAGIELQQLTDPFSLGNGSDMCETTKCY